MRVSVVTLGILLPCSVPTPFYPASGQRGQGIGRHFHRGGRSHFLRDTGAGWVLERILEERCSIRLVVEDVRSEWPWFSSHGGTTPMDPTHRLNADARQDSS